MDGSHFPFPDLIAAPAQPVPDLRCEELVCGYGGATVLGGVNLRPEPGGLTAIVGPNGCGKSTLLRTMARALRPQAGRVLLGGRPIHDLPTRRVARALALLPQGPVAPEGLTVRELVAQGRFPHQTLLRQWSDADAAAVARAMNRARVAEFAERPLEALSGGQRQRCWIAMVLAQDTPIVLLDEPTTFLDLKVQVDVLGLLRSIAHEEGRTVVVVLHEINMAAAFADRVVMMRAGRVIAEGTPADVVTAANLRTVFDLDADVVASPSSGRPVCIPAAGAARALAA
jgi:iron complex transport system ATP-binding protein